MIRPKFTLTVVASADGYIARNATDNPVNWASPEEQSLFFRDVDAAPWAIMGRNTHVAADRPDRHRIIFSTTYAGWRRPTQVWIDPRTLTPTDLCDVVHHRRPMAWGLILGGTRVHDWFFAHRAIDCVHLSIEPVRFGVGLPIFDGQGGRNPMAVFEAAGFRQTSQQTLNANGTLHQIWVRAGPSS